MSIVENTTVLTTAIYTAADDGLAGNMAQGVGSTAFISFLIGVPDGNVCLVDIALEVDVLITRRICQFTLAGSEYITVVISYATRYHLHAERTYTSTEDVDGASSGICLEGSGLTNTACMSITTCVGSRSSNSTN